jgi:hypothetical protein
MITVFGGLADVERDLIRTRTAGRQEPGEGTRPAYGPSAEAHPQQVAEARRRRAEGATLKELAESYDVGLATISRLSA